VFIIYQPFDYTTFIELSKLFDSQPEIALSGLTRSAGFTRERHLKTDRESLRIILAARFISESIPHIVPHPPIQERRARDLVANSFDSLIYWASSLRKHYMEVSIP